MHFLIFDRAPQPFDENIVHETAAPVHRNRDASGIEPAGEGRAGELRALIGVEDFRRAVLSQRCVERRDAKAGVHRVRQSPRQNGPAGPIDDRHQIQKAVRHRNVRNVAGPHMIGPGDRYPAQQIGIDLVTGRGLAGAGARNQRLDPHHAHQPLHTLAVDAVACLVEFERHPPRAIERPLEMQFVEPPHQGQIISAGDRHRAIDARTRQIQQHALPADRQILGRPLHHRPTLGDAHRPGLLAKKSLSTVNWPILV